MKVRAASVVALMSLTVLASSCAQAADGQPVNVTLTNSGCATNTASVHAGKTTFLITNQDAKTVSELELLGNGRIIGERENITPGMNTKFTENLVAGHYELYCPGGTGPETLEFTVTA